MSGTSLDGLDLVLVDFYQHDGAYKFEFRQCETISYDEIPGNWKIKLSDAYGSDLESLSDLNIEYARLLGDLCLQKLKQWGVTCDFIASHGHTIFHQPSEGLTYQLGNHESLAQTCGLPVVCDFRTQDVKLGGQGAPLVPIGDRLLFEDYTYCLNLGGFCNVSFEKEGKRLAFDIAPCNMLLNQLANQVGKSYDHNGELGRKGQVVDVLLNQWNMLEYYQQTYPKSLGREWYEQHFGDLSKWLDNYRIEDILRTAYQHIAEQIGELLKLEAPCLVTGGGAHNSFLTECIQSESRSKIVVPDTALVDFKEALIFAFLGILKWEEKINVLASVTGANTDHSSGVVYYPEVS